MLDIPKHNFNRSAKENNVGTNELGDWIEASLLFSDSHISKSDIVDILKEQQICDDQDLAHQIAEEGFSELRGRKKYASIADGLNINGNRVFRAVEWRDDPIRAFLVFLSLFWIYPKWASDVRNSLEQGTLFEKVVEVLCLRLFPDWKTYRVGWSPHQPVNIYEIIDELCNRLNCLGNRQIDEFMSDQTKDGGLDIVCYREFSDNKEAIPTFFIQCASGSNWRNKISTPNANLWQFWLHAAVKPSTGIATPFIIDNKQIRIHGLEGQIIFFDRLRLLSSYYSQPDILDNDLRNEIVSWLDPLVTTLPTI